MVYRASSDAVVVVHLAFIIFVVVGGFLAWRWPRLVWAHLPAVVWGVGIIVIGFDCPLTPLENWLRERGGDAPYEGGFVDRYIEDVVYPDEYTPHLRAVAALLIVASYAWLVQAATRRDAARVSRQVGGGVAGPDRRPGRTASPRSP